MCGLRARTCRCPDVPREMEFLEFERDTWESSRMFLCDRSREAVRPTVEEVFIGLRGELLICRAVAGDGGALSPPPRW